MNFDLRVKKEKNFDLLFISDDCYFLKAMELSNLWQGATFELIADEYVFKNKIREYVDGASVKDNRVYIFSFENEAIMDYILNLEILHDRRLFLLVNTPLNSSSIKKGKWAISSKYAAVRELNWQIINYVENMGVDKKYRLSKREIEVYNLCAEGDDIDTIAKKFNLSAKTVYSFRHSLINKVDFVRRGNLVFLRYAKVFC